MATTAPSSNLNSAASGADISAANVSSASIDNRRAQQLIERAMSLAERGDLPAAVLSCRQSIALAPVSSQGHSMLGLLLERAGDNTGAISAYERVLQLAPDSFLERESLSRLRVTAAQRRTARDLFDFDDAELFDDERPENLPSSAASKKTASGKSARAVSTPVLGASAGAMTGTIADGNVSDAVSQSVLKASAAQTVADAFQKPAPKPLALSADVPVAAAAESVKPAVTKTAAETPVAASAAQRSTQAAKAQAIDALAIASATAASGSAEKSAAAASRTAQPFPSTLPVPARNGGASRLPQIAPANAEQAPQPASFLGKIRQHPSFYFRGVPLASAAVLSLAFLLWAHSHATSGSLTTIAPTSNIYSSAPTTFNNSTDPANFTGSNSNAAPVNSAANAAAGAPAAAAPNATVGKAAPATTSGAATSAAARPAASTPASPSAPAAPVNSGASSTPAPAPVASSGSPATGGDSGDSGSMPRLPEVRLGAPAGPDDTVRIPASSGDGGSGGATEGYVRVAPSSSTIRPAARPENAAAGDERAAGSSARSGDNSAAIARMTRSIENGGDTAFRYQQRAQLQMQNGDANSAISDYNSAIAAYNDMIARGERVNIARAGIQACQRGIQLAQTRR